ncbi:neutral zinc metallopeptidase [Kribbella sp. NBC_01505]|uniref:neutral zinc metallopeptidase n=1 Tax=Kribbella sp. NBC_01505 TaxID=2903580 RepID=UPI00386F706C
MLKTAGVAVLAIAVAAVAGVATTHTDVSAVVPAPTPTPTVTPTPTPTPRPTVPYVTPTPIPTFTVEATRPKVIVANRLYSQGRVPAVPCALPDRSPLTKAELLSYARVMVKCLDRAWKPVVIAAKLKFRPVALVEVYDSRKPAATPRACEDPPKRAGAFYIDDKICINWPEYIGDFPIRDEAYFRDTFAHEYGHHLQNLAGILDSYELGHRKKRTKAVQLEDERRLELQANCLGGAFLGANRASFNLFGTNWLEQEYVAKHQGDELYTPVIRDHGSGSSQSYWTLAGLYNASPSVCNTFTAPPHEVE